MRVRKLSLNFFGHFTDKHFEFGERKQEQSDFHVIYGPNEAGKTTIMEAYLRLLYGFPHDEPYGFKHQRKNLQISASLEINEQLHHFIRLPTRANALLDEKKTVLPESALQQHLAGLAIEDYRSLLCMDDETIEKGGEEIVNSKGDIGSLLFSAAAGISNLTDVLSSVRSEADILYRARASSTRLAQLRSSHVELEKQIKEADVSASAYRQLKAGYDSAREQESRITQERTGLLEVKIRAQSLLRALPQLARVDELELQLAPFMDYPEQVGINTDELESVLHEQVGTQRELERLGDELAQLRSELENISYTQEHIALAEELQLLDELRMRYRAAMLDLEEQERLRQQAVKDMVVMCKDIDNSEHPDPSNFIISATRLNELEKALDKVREIDAAIVREGEEVEALRAEHETTENSVKQQLEMNPGGDGLARIFEQFDVNELSSRHAVAEQSINHARKEYQSALDALSIKGRCFESVPELDIHIDEVDEKLAQRQQLVQQIESVESDSERLQIDIAGLQKRVIQLGASEDVAQNDSVAQLFAQREALWSVHKTELSSTSAHLFEEVMYQLDSLSRLRLAQAADAGTLRQLQSNLVEHQATLDSMEKKLRLLGSEQLQLDTYFQEIAQQAGLGMNCSPTLLLDWLSKRDLAAKLQIRYKRIKEEHSVSLDRADRLRNALTAFVETENRDFQSVVNTARTIERRYREYNDKLQSSQDELVKLESGLSKRTVRLEQMRSESANAHAQWIALTEQNFPKTLNSDRLRNSFQILRDLCALETVRESAARTVTSMQQAKETFTNAVDELAVRAGSAVKSSPQETFAHLEMLCKRATEAYNSSTKLLKSIECREAELQLAYKALQSIQDKVNLWGAEFSAAVKSDTLSDLRKAVVKAEQLIQVRSELRDLEKQLMLNLNESSMVAVRASLSDVKASELSAELEGLAVHIETIEQQYKKAIETRTSSENALESVTGDAEVARLLERKSRVELQISETVMNYLKLHSGHQLAEEAIRRYRDQHRSGLLQATESAFAELTNGTYGKLSTQMNGSTEILQAVDASGAARRVQDMSKGTRFQLYLALRAAAYEQFASQGTYLPFICDDIFETFDEDRTRSACRLMHHIGQTGQSIYLTHHKHVVEIAQQSCGEQVQVHSII